MTKTRNIRITIKEVEYSEETKMTEDELIQFYIDEIKTSPLDYLEITAETLQEKQ